MAIAGSLLGASGSATAQQGAASAPPTAPAGVPSPAAPGGVEAQVGFERRPTLTQPEELSESTAILSRIDLAAGIVRRQLEGARAARDVVKTLCLNDKLSQIDVANRTGGDRQSALQAAVQRNDAELANHEFTILTVLKQRVEQLTAEANQCIGEELAFIGQTQITTSIDPNLPAQDTSGNAPSEPPVIVTPPECSTCTGQGP
jgi:hypothetical protein